MKKLIYCLLLLSFSCFSVDFYDCKYSEIRKPNGKVNLMGDGTISVYNNRFVAHDYVNKEYKSPKLTNDNDGMLIGEDSEHVYVLVKDRTNYAIASKRTGEAYQWDQCSLDTSFDFDNADFGKKPTNITSLIKTYFNNTLKDPDSAKYSDFSKPQKEFVFANKQPVTGYSVCVNVNAKNSYGGYTGKTLYWLFFKNNQIVRVQSENSKMISRFNNISCTY